MLFLLVPISMTALKSKCLHRQCPGRWNTSMPSGPWPSSSLTSIHTESLLHRNQEEGFSCSQSWQRSRGCPRQQPQTHAQCASLLPSYSPQELRRLCSWGREWPVRTPLLPELHDLLLWGQGQEQHSFWTSEGERTKHKEMLFSLSRCLS